MTEKIIRFGVSIEPGLLKKFDKMIKEEGYLNRSEAIRDVLRKELIENKLDEPNTNSIGTLTITYDHHTRNLTTKLINLQHDHNNEILSTTHIHIDHHNCLEVLILKGITGNIKKLADNIRTVKGVKQGELVLTKVDI